MRWTRREFSAVLAAGLTASRLPAQQKPPNVLLLLTSQHRGGALGCAGHPIVKTPNLDRLADDGALLSNFFAAAPASAPARASLLTGRYPQTHGVLSNDHSLHASERLLPEIFREYGYRTGLAGKAEFGRSDLANAFDFRRIFPGDYREELRSRFPALAENLYKVMEEGQPDFGLEPWLYGTSLLPAQSAHSFWIADKTLEFLTAGDSAQPWFFCASFAQPQRPFVAPMPWARRYNPGRISLPDLPPERPAPTAAEDREERYVVAMQERALRRLSSVYFGSISFVDEQIGRIVDQLERSEQLEDTIIVFTSDCGNALGEHGRMLTGCPYDPALRIPAIFHYPRLIPGGRYIEQVADAVCLTPTLLDWAGFQFRKKGFESDSASQLIAGSGRKWDGEAYSELGFHTVRTLDWKLTLPGGHPTWVPQLFDQREEPAETVNLYEDEAVRKPRKKLEKRLRRWLRKDPKPVKIKGRTT